MRIFLIFFLAAFAAGFVFQLFRIIFWFWNGRHDLSKSLNYSLTRQER